jgi:hypothetical protein
MGDGLKRVAKQCGGLTVTANGKTVKYNAEGKKGKKNYPWWIMERHNPQLGVYYVACGQMSKTAAKRHEDVLYGFNVMKRYETEEEYKIALEWLRDQGKCIQ